MANEQNLRPAEYKLSVEEQKKGGVKSGEARRRKRDLRLAMQKLLEDEYTTSDGSKISGAEAIALKQMEKALKGDAKAFELVRDTSGQKPVDVVEQVNVDAQYNEKMEILKRYLDAGTNTDSGTDKE